MRKPPGSKLALYICPAQRLGSMNSSVKSQHSHPGVTATKSMPYSQGLNRAFDRSRKMVTGPLEVFFEATIAIGFVSQLATAHRIAGCFMEASSMKISCTAWRHSETS